VISLAGRDILHAWGKFVFTGIGLGLLLCQGFVRVNDGTIEVQSEKGKGSTFVVTLPAA